MMDWRQAKQKLLQDKTRQAAYEKVDLGYEIGKMITDARIAKNMTQQKLAGLVGTKQPSIARIEKGDSLPSLSFLQKIARAFNTQLLPPRLEFLEDIDSVVTVSPKAAVRFHEPAETYLTGWSLLPNSSPMQWSGIHRADISTNKEFQYANS